MQRGWVVIGDGLFNPDLQEWTITNASVIRKWGTSRGLGELVNGPLAETVLDPAGTVRAHALTIVLRVDVDPEKWDN